MRQLIIFLFLIVQTFLFSQNKKATTLYQQYLLNNKTDSLQFVLKTLPNSKEKDNLLKIISSKVAYLDFVFFLQSNTFNNKNDVIKLNDFLNKKVRTPAKIDEINLDFIKLKWHQINQLIENEQIYLASIETKNVEKYINTFKNKPNDISYKKALIYAKQYEIILNLIKQDIKNGIKLCKTNLKVAETLNDTFLVLYLKNFLKEFLIYDKDLEGYLKICQEQTSLENTTNEKSVFYVQNIQDYLDASIFKGNFNEVEIENLLNEIYNYKNSKCYSYTYYAKYLAYQTPNSIACKRIYQKFNVSNNRELCSFFIKDGENKLNSNELITLYKEIADLLYNHKDFQKAADTQETISNLTKKVYSKELSQSIADYETRQKDFENTELKQVNKEKEEKLSKQKLIIFGTSIALLLFTILSYFLYKTIKQRNISNLKLETVNKDLNRLNILNQKIFTVIAHDFKAPIATLKYLLNKNTNNNPFIKEISAQLEQSDNMLNGLLDWAKSELNNTIVTEKFNLKNLNQMVLQETELQAQKKNIQFINNINEATFIEFPESVLKVVLRNVVNNAIKYSFENGKIEIDYSNNKIQVRDFGKGFDNDKLDQIFKEQVASSLGTNYESGFGIGLYFSFEMMKKHSGNIEVFPKEKGTLVSISFDDK